jgi:diguanylate cyclase
MQAARVAPTPRNYEIWFAFCSDDKPGLTQRVKSLLADGVSITAGVIDSLYQEFFGAPLDVSVARDASRDLHQIVGDMTERVTLDRSMLDAFGKTLFAVSTGLGRPVTAEELLRACAIVGNASVQAGERLSALEQLLSASIIAITSLRNRLAAAEKEATIDALTGLANRRLFDASLLRAGLQATEDMTDLSLLLLDIDHFKRFNDMHGHTVGDQVLRLFARMLLDQIKGRDTAARYGGEEFAVVLPGANLAGASALADQMRRALGQRPIVNRTSGQSLGTITCSIGVAQYRAGEAVADLIDRADKALYLAKHEGRNAVRAEA